MQAFQKRVHCQTIDKTKTLQKAAQPEKQMSEDVIPLDRLAKVYRKVRDEIQVLTQEYENKVEVLKATQEELKQAMKEQMQAQGVTSVRTSQGTIVLGVTTRYTTTDWDSFKTFVVEHDALDLYEKRVHQGNMKQFLEENPGLVPPGLSSNAEYSVSVRKPSK